MTESPSVQAEGPEPPGVADLLKEKHRETMAELDATIVNQLRQQPILHVPENTTQIFTTDTNNQYAYYREQIQSYGEEIERVRDEMYRSAKELTLTLNKLAQATDELNLVSDSLRRARTELSNAYQLIGQLVSYLDSIEWGTHDEWTRSQSLRERAHEYVESFNTIAY